MILIERGWLHLNGLMEKLNDVLKKDKFGSEFKNLLKKQVKLRPLIALLKLNPFSKKHPKLLKKSKLP